VKRILSFRKVSRNISRQIKSRVKSPCVGGLVSTAETAETWGHKLFCAVLLFLTENVSVLTVAMMVVVMVVVVEEEL
jgi:hypothetical protein